MKRRAEIYTYWTLEADLATHFSSLPEFASGRGYNIDLKCPDNGAVSIYVEDQGENEILAIDSDQSGLYVDDIIAKVTEIMSKHSEIHVHYPE